MAFRKPGEALTVSPYRQVVRFLGTTALTAYGAMKLTGNCK
jgi:hypothetical protein